MRTLLDTNILLRYTQPTHPMMQIALDALTQLRNQGDDLCLVPQNLYEYWVGCTRPVANNRLGMSAVEAETKIADHKRFFSIIDDTPAILPECERLLTQYQILGKAAHDARFVAAMLVHGIPRILTFNTQDFQWYPGIVVLSPNDVVQGPAGSAPPSAGPVP